MITLEEWAEQAPEWHAADIQAKIDTEPVIAGTRFDYAHYRAVVKAKRLEEYRARNVLQWSVKEDRTSWAAPADGVYYIGGMEIAENSNTVRIALTTPHDSV